MIFRVCLSQLPLPHLEPLVNRHFQDTDPPFIPIFKQTGAITSVKLARIFLLTSFSTTGKQKSHQLQSALICIWPVWYEHSGGPNTGTSLDSAGASGHTRVSGPSILGHNQKTHFFGWKLYLPHNHDSVRIILDRLEETHSFWSGPPILGHGLAPGDMYSTDTKRSWPARHAQLGASAGTLTLGEGGIVGGERGHREEQRERAQTGRLSAHCDPSDYYSVQRNWPRQPQSAH